MESEGGYGDNQAKSLLNFGLRRLERNGQGYRLADLIFGHDGFESFALAVRLPVTLLRGNEPPLVRLNIVGFSAVPFRVHATKFGLRRPMAMPGRLFYPVARIRRRIAVNVQKAKPVLRIPVSLLRRTTEP